MKETKTSRPGVISKKPAPPEARKVTTYADRYAEGKALRDVCPRNAHATWKAPAGRPDAVDLVLKAEKGRMPDLLPMRHGRMVRSAFTFYRGAALTMASDLASTPSSGDPRPVLRGRPPVQLRRFCHAGKACHLCHQRSRRDPPGAVGVGRQAPWGELRGGLPR